MQNLGRRTFTHEDLQWFARASGDYNPIHTNQVIARRLIAGDAVVHGVFIGLTMLEAYLGAGGNCPDKVKAYFPRPLLADEPINIYCAREDGSTRLFARRRSEEVASVFLTGSGSRCLDIPADRRPEETEPKAFEFEQLKELSGALDVTAAMHDIDSAFPNAKQVMGPWAVADFLALSRLVGMECPGFHSLFAGFGVSFAENKDTTMQWRVSRHLSANAPLRIDVSGKCLSGSLEAFVRNKPVTQPNMKEIRKQMPPDILSGERVLVVGGSRGLGEIVAKCAAASGANVCITYSRGREDALAVVDEITAVGGRCRIEKLNVLHLEDAPRILQQFNPTELFYFATPRITKSDPLDYDELKYESYRSFYVDQFSELMGMAIDALKDDIKVFYPSTVFIEQKPKGFQEYIDAKKRGEELCASLERKYSSISIRIKRLPPMKTDQTISFLANDAIHPLGEMVETVKQMASKP